MRTRRVAQPYTSTAPKDIFPRQQGARPPSVLDTNPSRRLVVHITAERTSLTLTVIEPTARKRTEEGNEPSRL